MPRFEALPLLLLVLVLLGPVLPGPVPVQLQVRQEARSLRQGRKLKRKRNSPREESHPCRKRVRLLRAV